MMLSEDRHELILRELTLRGSLNVTEFAAKMGISGMTVRRDLAVLDAGGLLHRVHGGAIATAPLSGMNGGSSRAAFAPHGESVSTAAQGADRTGSRLPLATIGMVVPSSAYYFPGIIRGAEAAAKESGVRLVLGVSSYSEVEERRQIQRLLQNGVDGLLVTPSEESLAGTATLALLAQAAVPVVVVERSIEDALDDGQLESVRSDHARGAEIAVNHLLAQGHRNIALCILEGSPTASRLREGYRRALQRAGLPHDDTMVRTISRARNDPQPHEQTVEGILDWCLEAGVSAAIVHNDEDALRFASACQERLIQVPENMAIIAYDDEIASLGTVPLSAVAPPKFDVGHQALVMCLNRIGAHRGGTAALQRVNLSPTLVIRDSSSTSLR
ncbi:substrate-binding domain-containing protein [Arthrobacter sp. CJ23]|uniref:substrate-binding domain-containing protein n=1 Tax=Arthrobacter sp. CJ23 TaxID=2972479 RepID=UPI00215D0564|nr:substrate-binding domain-containing protein [Arthrobacter sp. CJ23]UVJ39479.1 substrate-binding domain-containing protein [Arthrobacter sp. CJ23]